MGKFEIVKEIYSAFEEGDIPAFLERLADDVEWEYGAMPNDVPWLKPRKGKEEVKAFFDSLDAIELLSFTPTRILADDHVVVALIDCEGIVKKTGKHIVEEDEVHIWYFDENGKVAKFRHVVDSYQHVIAHQGVK